MPIPDRSILKNRRVRTVALSLLASFCWVGFSQDRPVLAQPPINRAEIVQILDSPEVYIQNKQAKVKDSANKGQRVRTAEARAQVMFNTGAVGRLSHNSVLTVGQCARLQRGTLLINGAMNGCTSSIVAGVRGTTYVMEVNEAGEANIKVLEGEVTVSKTTQPEEEAATEPASGTKQLKEEEPIVIQEGEQVNVSSTGKPGVVEKISQEEFTRLLQGALFTGFSLPIPGMGKIQSSFQRLYPGVPFPISLPGVPTPSLPIRLPF